MPTSLSPPFTLLEDPHCTASIGNTVASSTMVIGTPSVAGDDVQQIGLEEDGIQLFCPRDRQDVDVGYRWLFDFTRNFWLLAILCTLVHKSRYIPVLLTRVGYCGRAVIWPLCSVSPHFYLSPRLCWTRTPSLPKTEQSHKKPQTRQV